LNDKVSPEFTIYIPNVTIVPCIDITNLNQKKLEAQKKQDYYTFEIQRIGSVLQRDKSFSFRLSTLEEMVVWCKFLQNVATRPYDTLLQEKRSSLHLDTAYQETTPPPSPIKPQNNRHSNKVLLEKKSHRGSNKVLLEGQSDSSLSDRGIDTVEFADAHLNGRYDIYAPKLNI
jgi:hypothetical protein